MEHKNFSDVLLKTPVFSPEGFSSDHFNYVVGECEYNHSTIYRQLLLGAHCYADNIIIMEHDVLYPMNYAKTVSGILDSGMDLCYWARGKYFSDLGFFDLPNIMTLSRFSMKRKQFVKVFENKKDKDLKFVEPALRGIEIQGDFSQEIVTDNFAMVYGIDTLDIRHGLNVSGNYIVENYSQGHSYWGDYSEIYPMIDGPCRRLVESHPSYNYGIWN
jgi:hypothetical protein